MVRNPLGAWSQWCVPRSEVVSSPFTSICLSRIGYFQLREVSQIFLTYLLLGVWLAFPPNLEAFFLYGRALLAIGFVFACGLGTTLGIVVR